MDRIYPAASLLARLLEETAPWTTGLDAYLILDLRPCYALSTAPSVPRPRLIVTLNQCPLYLSDLMRCGPEGLIAASATYDLEQISQALAEVAVGRTVYQGPPSLETGLTAREQDMVRLAALGYDNREIAQELHITDKSVRNTIAAVLSKLGLRDRVQLCYYYLGLLDITRSAHLGHYPG